jgi:hypothetical protein
MKVVRTGFVILLAALAVQFSLAQSNPTSGQSQQSSSSSSSAQSTSSTQPQQQSPLQDQPTGIAAEQQAQQQTQKSGQLSQFEAPSGTQQDQSLGEIRLMTRYTQINGDPTRSFLDPGSNNLAEFNYFMDRRFLATHRIQTLTMFRATDDYSIDPEKDSLQKGFVRIYSPKDEYIIGDALVNYSRLTFNQNIKGVSTSWKLGDRWKLSMVGGIFIDRWGSLYKDLPTRPYTSGIAGARLAFSPTRNFTVGWNFSSSDDIVSTLPAAALGSVPQPASNRIGSMDIKYQQKNLRINGEYAYGITDFDVRGAGVPCTTTDLSGNVITGPCDTRTPQPNSGYQGDWGAQLEGSYRLNRFSLRASFVRFEPNFASINARQIADLEDILVRPGFDITNWMSIDGTMRYSGDDLKNQLPYKTTLWGPEARMLFHDLPFYRRAVLEAGWRDRIVSSGNYTTAPTSVAGTVDSYVRGPYAELTVPISTTFMTVGYERRNQVDMVDPANSGNTNRFYVGLRGVYDWGGWHINPSLRWELEREATRPFVDYNPIILLLEENSNRLDTISLLVEAPKWFIIEAGFRDANATITAATTDVPAIYYPNGYSRPSYTARVTYKIKNDENKLLVFSFERNNNYYYTSPNFDERIAGVTFIYKFGKRGR